MAKRLSRQNYVCRDKGFVLLWILSWLSSLRLTLKRRERQTDRQTERDKQIDREKQPAVCMCVCLGLLFVFSPDLYLGSLHMLCQREILAGNLNVRIVQCGLWVAASSTNNHFAMFHMDTLCLSICLSVCLSLSLSLSHHYCARKHIHTHARTHTRTYTHTRPL